MNRLFVPHSHIPHWKHGSGQYTAPIKAAYGTADRDISTIIKAIGKFSLDFVCMLYVQSGNGIQTTILKQ